MVRVDSGADDPAQLLVISALGLGVLLVILAVVLNSAIFTETLATHDESVRNGQIVGQTQHDARLAVRDLLAEVNTHHNVTRDSLDENFSAGIADWNRLAGTLIAGGSATAHISPVNRTYRTDVVQDDSTRAFTDRNSSIDWTLVPSTTNATGFRMNVTRESLYQLENGTCDDSSGCYYLEVANASNAWQLFVFASDNSSISARVVDGRGGTGSCGPTTAEHAWINVTAGTFAGSDCSALTFAEGVSGPYEIRYRNGHNATGDYRLRVDTAIDEDPHFNATESPYLDPAITGATVRFEYVNPEITYSTILRATPSERHA